MKSSLPNNWTLTTLGECAEWFSGGTPSTSVSEYWNGDIPWITASSLHEFYISDSERRVTRLGVNNGTRLVPTNTIIFVVRGMSLKTQFRVGITRRPVTFGQDCKAIIAKDNVVPLYLASVLRSMAPQILSIVSEAGHGTGRLETDLLKRLEIPLPPIEEQKQIAYIVSTLDDKIELNRRMNQTLETMAQAIFQSWFVDFDPVKAKMAAVATGRDPERAAMAVLVGKLAVPKDVDAISAEDLDAAEAALDQLSEKQRIQLAETAALFPGELVDSALGLIPMGWEVKRLSNEVELTMGQSPKSEFYNEDGNGMPFHQGVTNYGVRFPTHKVFCTVEDRVAQLGDVLFSVRAPVGRINIADRKLVIGRGLAAMRHRNNHQSFLIYYLNHQFQEEDIIGSGTIFNSVTKKDLESLPFLVPDGAITGRFEASIKPFDGQIARLDKQSETLAQLRDTLLPKLLSGELAVPDAEEMVG